MQLIHYSKQPFKFSRDHVFREQIPMKPKGLWFSIEHEIEDYFGWKDWCQTEGWNLDGLQYESIIELEPDATILELRTIEEMCQFTQNYGIIEDTGILLSGEPRIMYVRWDLVREKYQGIFIYPYHYQLRLSNSFWWYYGWDCSSGCIWDLGAIHNIKGATDGRE